MVLEAGREDWDGRRRRENWCHEYEREIGRVICRHVRIIQPVVREDSLSGDLRQCL